MIYKWSINVKIYMHKLPYQTQRICVECMNVGVQFYPLLSRKSIFETVTLERRCDSLKCWLSSQIIEKQLAFLTKCLKKNSSICRSFSNWNEQNVMYFFCVFCFCLIFIAFSAVLFLNNLEKTWKKVSTHGFCFCVCT